MSRAVARAVMVMEEICSVCGLKQDLSHGRRPVRIVAKSLAMQKVMRRIARIAPTEASVLLSGESGTGKEVVARSIHQASSRKNAKFVAINCAAIPQELLESELFGHSRGAFSGAINAKEGLFEEADRGTLFLDEIGDMPLPLQAKLLRVLQEGEIRRVGENKSVEVDVRIIAATNLDLTVRVAGGLFRQDLYYRLKVFSIDLPPLRDRKEDVLPLARTLLRQENPSLSFSTDAENALFAYSWPGNVRELQNAVRHGAVLTENARIKPEDLPPELVPARSEISALIEAGSSSVQQQQRMPVESSSHLSVFEPTSSLEDVMRAHVKAAVDACKGNRAAAARALGVGRNTLWRWLKNSNE